MPRRNETAWSRAAASTPGRTNIPLTEEGRRQARLAGASLRGRRFALVLTSPLQRAAETCRLAGFDRVVCDELILGVLPAGARPRAQGGSPVRD